MKTYTFTDDTYWFSNGRGLTFAEAKEDVISYYENQLSKAKELKEGRNEIPKTETVYSDVVYTILVPD